jgi:hypothetical protein
MKDRRPPNGVRFGRGLSPGMLSRGAGPRKANLPRLPLPQRAQASLDAPPAAPSRTPRRRRAARSSAARKQAYFARRWAMSPERPAPSLNTRTKICENSFLLFFPQWKHSLI